jgi:dihydroflavonol-4-reductase
VRAFVTGASGFIGRHLVHALSSAGHTLTCLVRNPLSAAWMKDLPGCEMVRGTLVDGPLLEECARGVEVVYHLAGCTSAGGNECCTEVNALGTERLARATAPTEARLVYLSSLSAAGPRTSRDPALEDDPPNPVSDYGRSKLLGEERIREILPRERWTILRAPAVFGPGDRDVLFLFRMASLGIIPQVAGRRTEVSVIHVEDLVRALLLAGTREASRGRLYHVSNGRVYTRDDLANALRLAVQRETVLPLPLPPLLFRAVGLLSDLAVRISGRPALLNSDKVREVLQPGWVCSSARIEKELGFSAAIGMEEGFRSTWEWYQREGWI